jgi:hypothetical protein
MTRARAFYCDDQPRNEIHGEGLAASLHGGLGMAANRTQRFQLNPIELVLLASSFALVALIAVLAWH